MYQAEVECKKMLTFKTINAPKKKKNYRIMTKCWVFVLLGIVSI